MRKAKVLYKDKEAGRLIQNDDGLFVFRYNDDWFGNSSMPAIALSLQKTNQEYQSDFLFSFFYNMLPEGANKEVVCKQNRIDEDDYFGILMQIAKFDSIGAVRIIRIDNV
jgi:serine/threonine-protein kinase HipA